MKDLQVRQYKSCHRRFYRRTAWMSYAWRSRAFLLVGAMVHLLLVSFISSCSAFLSSSFAVIRTKSTTITIMNQPSGRKSSSSSNIRRHPFQPWDISRTHRYWTNNNRMARKDGGVADDDIAHRLPSSSPVDNMTSTLSPSSTTTSSSPPTVLLDWNASGSIGSLLMQMQRKEEENKRRYNKTLLEQEGAVVDLSSNTTMLASKTRQQQQRQRQQQRFQQTDEDLVEQEAFSSSSSSSSSSELTPMNYETAKDLDDSITWTTGIRPIGPDDTVLELPSLYNILLNPPDTSLSNVSWTTTTTTTTPSTNIAVESPSLMTQSPLVVVEPPMDLLPSLSKPEHYRDRIGRDMRHLAVSIASSIEDVSQWRYFCQQQLGAGIVPLVDCIREGAKIIRQGQTTRPTTTILGWRRLRRLGWTQRGSHPIKQQVQRQEQEQEQQSMISDYVQALDEESFLAASSACRALRDLCALSPELSAVITDSLLRANVVCSKEGPSLMEDFRTLLKYAHDHIEFDLKQQRRQDKARASRLRRLRRRQTTKWALSGRKNRRGE